MVPPLVLGGLSLYALNLFKNLLHVACMPTENSIHCLPVLPRTSSMTYQGKMCTQHLIVPSHRTIDQLFGLIFRDPIEKDPIFLPHQQHADQSKQVRTINTQWTIQRRKEVTLHSWCSATELHLITKATHITLATAYHAHGCFW